MRKLFTFIAILMVVTISAQQPQQKLTRKQKRAIKTANSLDVLNYLPDTALYDQTIFWKSIVENNEEFKTIMAKFDDPGSLAKQAIDKVKQNAALNMFMNNSFDVEIEGGYNEAVHKCMLGGKELYPEIVFRINIDNDFNAFTTPDGYIYINSGAIDKTEPNQNMVYGILAHEIAHYVFKHMLVHEYNVLKRQRANNIFAGISTLAIGAANMVGAANGAPQDTAKQRKSYQEIVDGANEWTAAYKYRYGREEELSSDIVAYRFLEWMGEDPNDYIKMLEIMSEGWQDRETDRYDDHPSPKDRIEILNALTPAPWRIE